MMKPAARREWLESFFRRHENRSGVDILNADFVDEYAEETGAPVLHTPYGANRCPTLNRDLKAMFDDMVLKRDRVGIPYDMRGMGFPLWVWSYKIAYSPE